jgi:nucleoside-diphosphate-sugar epimerase
VADCFVFSITNAAAMVGRVFNLGLDAANMSKADLASLVQKHVPGFHVSIAEVGEDPDKRDYVVSNARLREAGFEATRSLNLGIAPKF